MKKHAKEIKDVFTCHIFIIHKKWILLNMWPTHLALFAYVINCVCSLEETHKIARVPSFDNGMFTIAYLFCYLSVFTFGLNNFFSWPCALTFAILCHLIYLTHCTICNQLRWWDILKWPKQPPKSPFVILKKQEMILKWNEQNTVRLPQKYQFLLIKHKINC